MSDRGSKVIRAFGILNTNVPEDHKMMYGMPWPGDFVIAPDGTVLDKLFLRNYEHRPSASQFTLRRHGVGLGANSVQIKTDVLTATIELSAERCFPGQELGVGLEVNLKPGWHVYGTPLPKNYQALELAFDSPLVEEPSLKLPPPTPVLLKAVGETLPVYNGEIQAVGTLRIRWSPPMPAPFLEALGARIDPGKYTINGTLRFQACSEEICEAPQAITFALPLQIEAGIPPAPKKPG